MSTTRKDFERWKKESKDFPMLSEEEKKEFREMPMELLTKHIDAVMQRFVQSTEEMKQKQMQFMEELKKTTKGFVQTMSTTSVEALALAMVKFMEEFNGSAYAFHVALDNFRQVSVSLEFLLDEQSKRINAMRENNNEQKKHH